jgi:hypothetical protein
MSITLKRDIFSQEEIDYIYQILKDKEPTDNGELGRVLFAGVEDVLKRETFDKLNEIVRGIVEVPMLMSSVIYTEYNSLYGKPNLPPHLDADINDLIINIQLESNTDWPLGLNLETYRLEDNSALIFNPNKEIHWRVHKEFANGDYVRMLFVRFCKAEDRSDYSYIDRRENDEMFRETSEFRDGLGIF